MELLIEFIFGFSYDFYPNCAVAKLEATLIYELEKSLEGVANVLRLLETYFFTAGVLEISRLFLF